MLIRDLRLLVYVFGGVWDSTNAALEREGHFWKAKACNVLSGELGREEIK